MNKKLSRECGLAVAFLLWVSASKAILTLIERAAEKLNEQAA